MAKKKETKEEKKKYTVVSEPEDKKEKILAICKKMQGVKMLVKNNKYVAHLGTFDKVEQAEERAKEMKEVMDKLEEEFQKKSCTGATESEVE